MPDTETPDHRRAIAERNVEAILDAAERVLRRREQASISAVATEAGLSRVTVYAHFRAREPLLEGVVERAVQRAMVAIEEVEPDRGPADEALLRVISAGWNEIGRNAEIGAAAMGELSADAMRRSHATAQDRIHQLTERGCREGAFRTDVRLEWLVSAFFALIHAASEEVNAGRLPPGPALDALVLTIPDLFAAPDRPRKGDRHRNGTA